MSRQTDNQVTGYKSPSLLPLHDASLKAGLYLQNWSTHTLRVYRTALTNFGIERPTKTDVDAWVIRIRQKGFTPGGVNVNIRSVNSYLTWLREEGHIETPSR